MLHCAWRNQRRDSITVQRQVEAFDDRLSGSLNWPNLWSNIDTVAVNTSSIWLKGDYSLRSSFEQYHDSDWKILKWWKIDLGNIEWDFE